MDRVLASEARGCGFDPRRAHQFIAKTLKVFVASGNSIAFARELPEFSGAHELPEIADELPEIAPMNCRKCLIQAASE